MLIMSTQLSPTTFSCISVLACANSWARQHFISKNKPLASMSTNFSASSLTLNQSTRNPSAAFTRQGTSNRQLKHLTHGLPLNDVYQSKEMDNLMYQNFPINLEEGSKTKARNGEIYGELQHGVKYLDIYEGDGKMGKEGDKFDIDYEVYDKAGEYIGGNSLKKFPSVNLDTGHQAIKRVLNFNSAGLPEGIKGMRSGGRRIIIIPPNLADQDVEKGEYAICHVAIEKIHSNSILSLVLHHFINQFHFY